MPLPSANLERELSLILLSLHLQKHPEQATILAMNHYEDYMSLADDYKKLRAEFEALQIENIKLKSFTPRFSPQLPSFLDSSKNNS